MKPIATALLLNWKRPENIVKTIASIRAQTAPIEIWLWNNNPDDKTAYDVDMQINSPRNFFCWPRWLLGSMAETEFIFTLDDDLMFADDNVIQDCIDYMHVPFRTTPIIGYSGVSLSKELNYWKGDHFNEPDAGIDLHVNVVKGRFMFMHSRLIRGATLQNEPTCEDIKISALMPFGNIVPKFLHNRLINLSEGDEALFAQPWQRERRQQAVEKYFR